MLLLIKEVIEIMQYSANSHRIGLDTSIGKLMVNADRPRIEQVIINLLSNAVKYSPGASLVNVSVSVNDNKALVTVQDFGLGITPDQQERIFNRFYRVEDMAAHIGPWYRPVH